MLNILFGCQPGTGEFDPPPIQEIPDPVMTSDLLTQIQDQVFTPICAECHSGSQASAGLRLESVELAYEFLVSVTASGNQDFQRVVPDDPDNSYLVLKVEGDPRAGARMPLGRAALSGENIQLIRRWIEQGALPAESSQSLTKVLAVSSVTNQIDIEFSQPINTETVTKENILVFENIGNEKFLLSPTDYSLKQVDRKIIGLTMKNQQQNKSFSLIINHPATSGLLDKKGRLLDGDDDQLEGGEYEYKF